MLALVLYAWFGMVLVMGIGFLVQLRTRNAGIVDALWAAGVGAAGMVFAWGGTGLPGRRMLLAGLAALWGFRLAGYLFFNRVWGRPEDGRYAMLREKWGEKAFQFLFIFFQIQALWVVLFALPFLAVGANSRAFPSWLDALGVLIWILAVAGESLADSQLARFRDQPGHQGKTCRSGLWHYSRHPNYFFEWVHWFAYVVLALGSPLWWLSLSGPVVMLVFLYKITGIPYTEKCALQSRGDDYRRYQETTSAFVPWFPRKTEHLLHKPVANG